jgi:hypothetical protein
MNAFKEKFPGAEIIDIRKRDGTSRKVHKDFDICVYFTIESVSRWYHVEHKGKKSFTLIKPDAKPWAPGVQFYNGPCKQFSSAKIYARIWYNIHVVSGTLKTRFNIEAPIPEFDDWYTKDCTNQGDPRTPFGKELKQKYREQHGGGTSLLDEREVVNKAFNITDAEKEILIREAVDIATKVLDEKDYWLNIHGDLLGDFNVAWHPKYNISKITGVNIKQDLDLNIEFLCDNGNGFNAILRWGKGAGFSNLRLDLK